LDGNFAERKAGIKYAVAGEKDVDAKAAQSSKPSLDVPAGPKPLGLECLKPLKGRPGVYVSSAGSEEQLLTTFEAKFCFPVTGAGLDFDKSNR
jgi:hypothetical protein